MKPFYEWRGAVLASDLQPTTRFVLLTLGCHMNDQGESCFPSIETLVSESGLSRAAVIKHLGIAKDLGWIVCEKHGYRNSKWARNDYRISYPEGVHQVDLDVEMVVHQVDLAPQMVVHQVDPSIQYKNKHTVNHSVQSKSSATNSPPENRILFDSDAGQFRDIPESRFDEWESLFKKIDVLAELERAEGWLMVNPKKRKKNYDRFLHNWFSRAADRTAQRARPFVASPQSASAAR